MAVELCKDNPSRAMSPRISFSCDLNQSDVIPIEPHLPFKSSSLINDSDFDFCNNRRSCDQDSSLADEIFSNGVILPVQIKTKQPKSSSLPPLPPASATSESVLKEEREGEEKHGSNSKSFWGFKRSKSLNCGRLYGGGLCPLPLLNRSKSTGSSSSSSKRVLVSKEDDHHHHQHQNLSRNKQNLGKNASSSMSISSSSSAMNVMGHHHRPPLRKNYGAYSNRVTVNPVLNMPSGFFGLGSIFCNVKDKSRKRW